jgi:hypothetical protein
MYVLFGTERTSSVRHTFKLTQAIHDAGAAASLPVSSARNGRQARGVSSNVVQLETPEQRRPRYSERESEYRVLHHGTMETFGRHCRVT